MFQTELKKLTELTVKSGFARASGFILLILLVFLRIWDPAPLETFRLKVFDFYQVLHPRPQGQLPVIIVDIDEQSLQALGQWPWPRTRIADLVSAISKLGGVAIGFDILFAEPDRMSPALIAKSLISLDQSTREKLRQLPGNDQVFATAIKRSRVVLGQSGYQEKLTSLSEKNTPYTSFATLGKDPSPYLFTFPGLRRNIPVLEKAALGRGLITILPESDGIIRRVPIVMKAQGRLVPSLTSELLRVATGSNAILIKTNDAGISSVVLGGVEIPTDENGQLWIHFNAHNKDRYVSAKDILDGTVDQRKLAGKLVLVGTSAIGLFDIKTTPIDAAIPGVEVHAQTLETIMSNSFLTRPNYAIAAEITLAALVGLVIIILVPMTSVVTVIFIGGTIAAGLVAMSWYLFIQRSMLIDVAYPLLSSLIIFSTLVFINYFREERERSKVRSAFGQYLSPDLVEQLAENPEKLVLGGETRELTILFSDVRGFTTISESYKSDPQGLTTLINRLLTPLSNAVMDTGGTIDKYMGDNIMAFWNAPLDNEHHARDACTAALSMLTRLKQLNVVRKQEAETNQVPFLPLEVGIGINTGECVVGNIGSDMRFDYSVLGDSVNLAARLEGQTKSYGVSIIIGSKTATQVKGTFAVLELDAIRVKGKTEPEVIYTMLGEAKGPESKTYMRLEKETTKMLAHYRNQEWTQALNSLKNCRQIAENLSLDALFDIYQERIKTFKKSSPPSNWDGVWTMTSK
jgi:adenylate cyclase